ncbi:MAG: septum formation protein Maf [Kiritimatiellaeota bacterium]|nr:septum formation protein Maf [Kiritimatiellota bacterium]
MKRYCVLASTSPRRVEILRGLGVDFIVRVPEADELDASKYSTERLPIINARIKSESIADEFPESIVLGADTVVLLGDRLLGKPSTEEEALEILMSLSGKTHVVVTGVCLTRRADDVSCVFAEKSNVLFKRFDVEMAKRYMEEVHVLDKAGAYAAQERGSLIIEKVDGSFTNVMGLPAEKLSEAFSAIRALD